MERFGTFSLLPVALGEETGGKVSIAERRKGLLHPGPREVSAGVAVPALPTCGGMLLSIALLSVFFVYLF